MNELTIEELEKATKNGRATVDAAQLRDALERLERAERDTHLMSRQNTELRERYDEAIRRAGAAQEQAKDAKIRAEKAEAGHRNMVAERDELRRRIDFAEGFIAALGEGENYLKATTFCDGKVANMAIDGADPALIARRW